MKNIVILIIGVILGYGIHGIQYHLQEFSRFSLPTAVTPPKLTSITPATTPISTAAENSTPTEQYTRSINNTTKLDESTSVTQLMQQIITLNNNQQYTDALVKLEELLFQIQEVYSKAQINQLFIDTVERQLAFLADNLSQQITLLEYASGILPEYNGFKYRLAAVFFKLDDIESAKYYLTLLYDDINWKEKIKALREQIAYREIFMNGDIQIPLIAKTNAWHIELEVNQQKVVLILDTGATTTVVKSSILNHQYEKNRKILVSTANGQVDAYITTADLKVGVIDKPDFDIIVLEDDKLPEGVDGLLGVDFFTQYNFIIDKTNSMLQLTPLVNSQ